MEDNSVQSEFEREVETYRAAMDDLHRTADAQQANYDGLDAAMGDLKRSVAKMTDAVDEYDTARDELDAAVVSLQKHAEESQRASARGAPATGHGPVAGD
jgi:chromosome segregation ATPase